MYTRSFVLAVAAAAASFVDGAYNDVALVPAPEITPAAAGTSFGGACCLPKLCTDDAIIKGTTTHLTYLCPDVTTVLKTETVFVTVPLTGEGKPSQAPYTSGHVEGEKTTTVTVTSKSTALLTKTIHSAPPGSSGADSSVAVSHPVTTLAAHTSGIAISPPATIQLPHTTVVWDPAVPSHYTSTGQSTATTIQTVDRNVSSPSWNPPMNPPPGPLRPFNWSSILINPRKSTTVSLLTNPLRPTATTSSGIYTNSTTCSVVATHSESSVALVSSTGAVFAISSSVGPIPLTPKVHIVVSKVNSTLALEKPTLTSIPTEWWRSPHGTASDTVKTKPTLTSIPTEWWRSPHGTASDTVKTKPTLTSIPTEWWRSPHGTASDTVKTKPTDVPIDPNDPAYPPVTFGPSSSLPSDLEIFPTVTIDNSTSPAPVVTSGLVSDMEKFPTLINDVDPTGASFSSAVKASTLTDGTSFSSDVQASTLTDGTFFSSDVPPYPTKYLAARHGDNEHHSNTEGTISKVITTTTVTLEDSNSTSTVTQTASATVNRTTIHSHPGVPTTGGAGNVRGSWMMLALGLVVFISLLC